MPSPPSVDRRRGMITTVLLPEIRRSWPTEQRIQVFHALEVQFVRQARVTTLLPGRADSTWYGA